MRELNSYHFRKSRFTHHVSRATDQSNVFQVHILLHTCLCRYSIGSLVSFPAFFSYVSEAFARTGVGADDQVRELWDVHHSKKRTIGRRPRLLLQKLR
jgi:hypothetical protein